MKNKYFILSTIFALYPIVLNFIFNDAQISYIYSHIYPMKLADLILDIIINSVYVSVILGIIFGIICLIKSKFQNIYVWIPIALSFLFALSYVVGLL
jgi:hypothetical protein